MENLGLGSLPQKPHLLSVLVKDLDVFHNFTKPFVGISYFVVRETIFLLYVIVYILIYTE